MAKLKEVTDAEFEGEVLDSALPVVVDFWAEWCGPCHQLTPVVEQLADEYDGRIKFVKMDTEENFDTPARYGIRGLPTLLIFHSGQKVEEIAGAKPKSGLKRSIDRYVV